jgi:hypothetical protein
VAVIAWLRRLWRKHIVSDVPAELDAYEKCRQPYCTREEAATCEERLACVREAKENEGKKREVLHEISTRL